MKKVRYGGHIASAKSAAGMRGVLCRSTDGEYFFRIYRGSGRFTDYELRHSDLTVTIAEDEEATFYRVGKNAILDHSPETLGLNKAPSRKKRQGAKGNK